MIVQLLPYKSIDKIKWDNCIDSCINAMPYAYSWYLDIVCNKKWDAIILDDYKAVFPLPLKNYIIYSKIYQPFFTQQLGLFYTNERYLNSLDACFNLAKKTYTKINLHLNTKNIVSHFKQRITYHIDLNKSFEELVSHLSSRVIKNIKASQNKEYIFSEFESSDTYINFMKTHLGEKLDALKQKDFLILKELIDTCISKQIGKIYCIKNADNLLVAGAFILIKNNYIIYLVAASSPEGKKMQAMTLLIYTLMKQFSGKNYLLDFEGSMIESIAYFYQGFGGIKKHFPVLEK